MAILLFAITNGGSVSTDTTVLPVISLAAEPSSTLEATTTTSVDSRAEAEAAAVRAVEEYWAILSGHEPTSALLSLLDMPSDQALQEFGLAEYSAAYGGRYEAACTVGVIVEEEVSVDCIVEMFDEPLASAFDIGATPTQFRVIEGRISRVGYLKPYSTIDLALSLHAERTDEAGFLAACSNERGLYLAEAGVVYNGSCGAYMAELVSDVLAEVRSVEACGDACDAALLNAIRPSRD